MKLITKARMFVFDVQDNEEMLNRMLDLQEKLNEVIEAVNTLIDNKDKK